MSAPVVVPAQIAELASAAERIVALTGAGMSAESGLATFRDPHTGLWARFSPEDLASADAWAADPELVWAWYLWRFERIADVHPNAGHRALAAWALAHGLPVVTQNVDDLHERAGSPEVVHVHGRINSFRCADCERPYADPVAVPTSRWSA